MLTATANLSGAKCCCLTETRPIPLTAESGTASQSCRPQVAEETPVAWLAGSDGRGFIPISTLVLVIRVRVLTGFAA